MNSGNGIEPRKKFDLADWLISITVDASAPGGQLVIHDFEIYHRRRAPRTEPLPESIFRLQPVQAMVFALLAWYANESISISLNSKPFSSMRYARSHANRKKKPVWLTQLFPDCDYAEFVSVIDSKLNVSASLLRQNVTFLASPKISDEETTARGEKDKKLNQDEETTAPVEKDKKLSQAEVKALLNKLHIRASIGLKSNREQEQLALRYARSHKFHGLNEKMGIVVGKVLWYGVLRKVEARMRNEPHQWGLFACDLPLYMEGVFPPNQILGWKRRLMRIREMLYFPQTKAALELSDVSPSEIGSLLGSTAGFCGAVARDLRRIYKNGDKNGEDVKTSKVPTDVVEKVKSLGAQIENGKQEMERFNERLNFKIESCRDMLVNWAEIASPSKQKITGR